MEKFKTLRLYAAMLFSASLAGKVSGERNRLTRHDLRRRGAQKIK